ncbi:MAG: hypothetical protein HOC74_19940 [Gemmatimonadetes bacterium]|jgi:hypothetical protein|nr:hypothetical protein [Gemmatimonadota bacterium]
MENLPLPVGLLDRYKDAFIPSFLTPFAIQGRGRRGRGWHTETRRDVYLTDGRIEAHLQGRYFIAPVAKTYAKTITIDLDRRQHWRSLEKRTEKGV